MTTEEAIVLAIVASVMVIWDVLIAYQVRRGETFAFAAQKWEPPRRRIRAAEPRAFWVGIGLQALVANLVLGYLLWFALSSS